MNDNAALHDDLTLPDPEPPAGDTMASRLNRLEHAIAALQDTRLMEERLVERLSSRLPAPSAPAAKDALAEAGKTLLPTAMRAVAATANAAALPPNRSWLVFDLLHDFRTFWRMPFDYRYRLSWAAKLVPLAGIGMIIFSWVFVRGTSFLGGGVPVVGGVLDVLIVILTSVVVFKTWSREAARYREQTANLPPLR